MKVRYKINGIEATEEEFVRAGDPAKLPAMLASGRPPGCMTDAVFLEGHANGSQFEKTPGLGDFYADEARKAGVDCKGKVYLSGLAAYPGDPRAWVGGRGDAQRVCEERGWACDGAVSVKIDKDKVAAPTGGGVAPDLVAAEATSLTAETGVAVEEAAEKVYELRKPHWVK